MLYIVTLSLRTISVIERYSTRRPPTDVPISTQYGAPAFPQKFNEALVQSLFRGLSKPLPDHVTLPPRVDILPARILLFYFDKAHARTVLKTKPVNEAFCIGVGQYRRIVADMTATTETELRAFILAARVVKNVSRLRKKDLITALILGDYRKVTAEKTRITALHARLEMKTEELRAKVSELKCPEIGLASMNSSVEGNAMIKFKRHRASILSAGRVLGEPHPHRYPTRYSLTCSVEGES